MTELRKTKVMISQPMTGHTEEEIQRVRKEAIEYLESQGLEVIDHYNQLKAEGDKNYYYVTHQRIRYLADDLKYMSLVDAVYFCHGWETSKGCIAEHELAKIYGLTILYAPTYRAKNKEIENKGNEEGRTTTMTNDELRKTSRDLTERSLAGIAAIQTELNQLTSIIQVGLAELNGLIDMSAYTTNAVSDIEAKFVAIGTVMATVPRTLDTYERRIKHYANELESLRFMAMKVYGQDAKSSSAETPASNNSEPPKERAMISQPMNGKTDDEIKATRARATEKLHREGYEVVDSFFNEAWATQEAAADVVSIPVAFLSRSIERMSACHAVYFCKGWEGARGCKIEHDIAVAYGLRVIIED